MNQEERPSRNVEAALRSVGMRWISIAFRRPRVRGMCVERRVPVTARQRIGSTKAARGYCCPPLVSSMKAVSRLTSSSRNNVMRKPDSNNKSGRKL